MPSKAQKRTISYRTPAGRKVRLSFAVADRDVMRGWMIRLEERGIAYDMN